jgi:hypothetical protein
MNRKWSAAVASAKTGNTGPLAALLPDAKLLPLFVAAIGAQAELQKTVDAAAEFNNARLEQMYQRVRGLKFELGQKAEYDAGRRALDNAWAVTRAASRAARELQGLQAYMPELFGGDPGSGAVLRDNFALPATVLNELRAVSIDPYSQAWHDYGKPPEQRSTFEQQRTIRSPLSTPGNEVLAKVLKGELTGA